MPNAVMPLYKTAKTGRPALWESGAGYTNTGVAQVIAGPNGEPLQPLVTRSRMGESALFKVEPGYWVIKVRRHRLEENIDVFRILEINSDGKGNWVAAVEEPYSFGDGEWDQEPPENLKAAVEAARKKARCYHCRHVHYAS